MFDPNWTRWIAASITKFFYDNRGGLEMYAEGSPRDTQKKPDFFEFRFDGPSFSQDTKDEFYGQIIVNCLIQHSPSNDKYAIYKMAGIVQAIFLAGQVSVFKYGDQMGDDMTQVGCLQLLGNTTAHYYGFIEPNVQNEQMSVVGTFKISL